MVKMSNTQNNVAVCFCLSLCLGVSDYEKALQELFLQTLGEFYSSVLD